MRFPLATAAAVAFAIPAASQHGEWLTDFEAAKANAKEQNRVILADFTGSDWCGWCIKLKDEVFSKPEFVNWAKEKVVLLELDFPRKKELPAELKEQNNNLKKQYGITGYPTILFLDAEGKQIGKLGYKAGGPENWIKLAEEQMAAKTVAAKNTDEQGGWLTSHEQALKLAAKEKKVVLANFTGSDWCGWCIKLKDEVFSKPEFKEWAADNVVLLELDFPRKKELPAELRKQNESLARTHSIQGYPTILFLDATGKAVGKSGYVQGGPTAWIAAAEKELGGKLKKGKKSKT